MSNELRPPIRITLREEDSEEERYLRGLLIDLRREYDLRAAPLIRELVRIEAMRSKARLLIDPATLPPDFDPTKS